MSSYPTTPKTLDAAVNALLTVLDLPASAAEWLRYKKPRHFTPERNECHINVWLQLKYEQSGSVCSGWTLWQHKPTRFVEAQFHTVWRNDEGRLIDVTPRQDGEKKVLFIPDPKRCIRLTDYEGAPAISTYDNVRMQSGNVLTGPEERVHVLTTQLIYEHGLAVRSPQIR